MKFYFVIFLILIILSLVICYLYKNSHKNNKLLDKIVPENKYIFIGGLHRSGTSILNQIIGSSLKVSKHENTNKAEDEGQHFQTVYDSGKKHGGLGKFCFDKDYHYTEKSHLITNKNKKKLLNQWNKYWDTKNYIFVEKSPVNLIHTRFLQEFFKNTYFVIIIRHPLAVSRATINMLMKFNDQNTVDKNLNNYFDHWLLGYDIFLNDSKYLKKHIMIKYEDLCENPKKIISKIEFLLDEKLNISKKNLDMLEDSNHKYFKEKISEKLINKYEDKFNKFGYSLKNI